MFNQSNGWPTKILLSDLDKMNIKGDRADDRLGF